jgi:hypothetical protein
VNNHPIPPDQASVTAHQLCNNNRINRYSFEEYIAIFNSALYREKNIVPLEVIIFSGLYSGKRLTRINSLCPSISKSYNGLGS